MIQGGPGCSSFDGSLMEVGPFRTISASKTPSGNVDIELVEGGWEEFATVVFSACAGCLVSDADPQSISRRARVIHLCQQTAICMIWTRCFTWSSRLATKLTQRAPHISYNSCRTCTRSFLNCRALT
jgi:hypothetical protein